MPITKKLFKSLISILQKPKKSPEDISKICEFLSKIKDFSPYIISLSSISLEEVASTLKLEKFHDQEKIFDKGDKSDKLYIIAKGYVWLYDVDHNQNLVHFTSLNQGKVLGERGLIRNLPRSLTAISKKKTYLVTLEVDKFLLIIDNQLQSNVEEKINFIEKTFPKTVGFRVYQRERMAYCMDVKQYKRDDVIIAENRVCDYLMILFSGECLLEKRVFDRKVKISCIESGCFVAEECVFLNQPSHFYYKVVTDAAKVYFIKKQHFFLQCPPDLLKKLSLLCRARVAKRDKMAESASLVAVNNETSFKLSTSFFPGISKIESRETHVKSLSQTKSVLVKLCRKFTHVKSSSCIIKKNS
jgi:CRP-like cAMP-binding protein